VIIPAGQSYPVKEIAKVSLRYNLRESPLRFELLKIIKKSLVVFC